MYYNNFKDLKLSALGLGCMRLPCIDGDDSRPDQEQVNAMVDYAIANGINYFDTAWGYHNGNSEIVIGKALARYPRESFYLASKFPGYDVSNFGKHEEIFEKQLEKCGVDYFDFYLFHNVAELNIEQYLDDGISPLAYLVEQKKAGRIKHLGFSVHANQETFERFLEKYRGVCEFCQIQLNYLDYEFQDARHKIETLTALGMPIWVMEGLRGGKLAKSCLGAEKILAKTRPDWTPANWGFGFLQSVPGVTMILSGMSNMEQLVQNTEFFGERHILEDEEMGALLTAAHFDTMGKDSGTVPCTGCRYCTSHCPMELDIPWLLSLYNEHKYSEGGFIAPMALEALSEDRLPSACIRCGFCAKVCPQKIDIPGTLEKFTELMKSTQE